MRQHPAPALLSIFSLCLSLRCVYILHQRKHTHGHNKTLFIRNCSCVLQRPLISPWLLWKHAIRGSASLSGMSERKNLWIQANQMLPGGPKAKWESQWCREIRKAEIDTSQLELSIWPMTLRYLPLFSSIFRSTFLLSFCTRHTIPTKCHSDSG